jgi:hypothetical protein
MNHEETAPLPSHLTSRIAAELHDNIIDHLHTSKHALSTCSTVCKAWLPTCRYHLFSTVNLRPDFVEFVRGSSHAAITISPYICHVTLGGGWVREHQTEFNEVISFLLTLESVTELSLDIWSWDYITVEASTSLLDARASLFRNLTRLTMTHIRFPSFDLLIQFISGFPMLQELSLHKVTWEAPGCSPSNSPSTSTLVLQTSPPLSSRLQALTVFSSSNLSILCWVSSGHTCGSPEQAIPALRTLVLPDIIPTESNIVDSVLRKAGPSLQHLELGFLVSNSSPPAIQGLSIFPRASYVCFMNPKTLDALSAIDLSYNTNLRSICMHQLILYQFPPLPTPSSSTTPITNSPYAWLIPFLSQINSPHLVEIAFNIWLSMESQLDLIDWKGLAKVTLNPQTAKSSELRFEVSGVGRDMYEVKGWIWQRLREWGWEGKLSVKFAID